MAFKTPLAISETSRPEEKGLKLGLEICADYHRVDKELGENPGKITLTPDKP